MTSHFTPPLLSTIKAKTLVISGDSDPLYPVQLAFELHTHIPDATLWVVPGGGRVPVFGERKDQFVREAHAFFS